jgi:xanthine dehydrogenase large subunit
VNDKPADRIAGGVATPVPHESAAQHVSGAAWYTDDIPAPAETLHAAIGMSPVAHGKIRSINLDAVRLAPGVRLVITAADIPGDNNCGPVVPDDPIFASDIVEHVGQSLFAVAATSANCARRAARLAVIDIEPLPPLVSVDAALQAESFVLPSEHLVRGDVDNAFSCAKHQLQGSLRIGGQEQFYLEGQIAFAVPRDGNELTIYSSTQFPMEIQAAVARCLGRTRMSDVDVECRRMGGAFGGKESQPALFACIVALLADATAKPVKLRMDRDDDMVITGKRHDFLARYEVGYGTDGTICAYRVELASRCGRSADLSGAINDRAMLHSDNAYFLPAIEITSHRCKTHTVSNTAFRGFGGPQGMLVIEHVIEEIAQSLQCDPLDVRLRNLYGPAPRDRTPYDMRIEDNELPSLLPELADSADYRRRRAEIRQFNLDHLDSKRGIAITPVKFGISFTATHLNQAGALINIYHDGSIALNHGGTEMGQGLFTKVAQVVAEELQVDITRIRTAASDTAKIPNASATAASSGTDLNGKAAQAAARKLRDRLTLFASELYSVAPSDVTFLANQIHVGATVLTFDELVHLAYMHRVPLAATGFYKTPKIGYDRRSWQGRPFFYFAYGAAVSEVEVDALTGEYKLLRVDISHDCGESINPAIDRGQIEGGFLQGVGWLTCEELVFAADGKLLTTAPSTYKIPACADWPAEYHVRLLESSQHREDTVFRSKAVGEPPLMLAISTFLALRDAVASVARDGALPELNAPATPETVLLEMERLRRLDANELVCA